MDIGNRLTQLRELRGLTTNRLANLSGLSQSFVRSVELGEKGISVENLGLLCEAMRFSLRDFFLLPEDSAQTTEQALLSCISSLTEEEKQALLVLLKR